MSSTHVLVVLRSRGYDTLNRKKEKKSHDMPKYFFAEIIIYCCSFVELVGGGNCCNHYHGLLEQSVGLIAQCNM